ncbi:unnamed protein product [Caenorhabditis angaria]|uniref:Uncharacterized protein n=1 Tax=Caenorhabditis angaria TaxID=860376 RepID=A0A9P1J4J9_9PELO|nr:unnamed protein product [Caenorhabditis angaria]
MFSKVFDCNIVKIRNLALPTEVQSGDNNYVSPSVYKTCNSKKQEGYEMLCQMYRDFLIRSDFYGDSPTLRKDNTFDVREIAMFMIEMNRRGFLVYEKET